MPDTAHWCAFCGDAITADDDQAICGMCAIPHTEQLAKIEQLRAALRPFANWTTITQTDINRARAALEATDA